MKTQAPIFVVSWGGRVEQAFARLEDAVDFAGEFPNAEVTRHQVRQSMREAVVVYDRHVVVAGGARVVDRTDVVHQFFDDAHDAPGSADVEWFRDGTDARWHVAGFGTDAAALDAAVQTAVDLVGQLDGAPNPQPAHGGAQQ
jgi:hypothetical protein